MSVVAKATTATTATIRRDGDRLVVDGPVNMDSVPTLLTAGAEVLAAGAATIDLSKATGLDSSAVALILAWQRDAEAAGRTLHLAGAPPAFGKLAKLYAVTDLLPKATA